MHEKSTHDLDDAGTDDANGGDGLIPREERLVEVVLAEDAEGNGEASGVCQYV